MSMRQLMAVMVTCWMALAGVAGQAWGEASTNLDRDNGGADVGILPAGMELCPRTPCSLLTSLVGTVVFEGGLPVESAVLVNDQGGKGVSGVNGAFSLQLEVAKGTTSLTLAAVASVGGVTYTGSKQVSRLEPGSMTDVGAITVTSGGCAGEFAWLPTFGGAPGVSDSVNALTVFDDGLGGGPALYAGGNFTTAGEVSANFIAKWGCAVSAAPCPADLNGDGTVDISDLFAVLAAWGACDGCPQDLTGDGVVDLSDLLEVLSAWGECS